MLVVLLVDISQHDVFRIPSKPHIAIGEKTAGCG
jgi:hypothetical protein